MLNRQSIVKIVAPVLIFKDGSQVVMTSQVRGHVIRNHPEQRNETQVYATWESELRASLTTADDLAEAGLIPKNEAEAFRPVLAKYKFLLTPYYAGLIDPSDPHCPIRKQSIPDLREMSKTEWFAADPLQDLGHQPTQRTTNRYRNRCLIHLTPNCSMYCRFCFRKTLLNADRAKLFGGDLEKALEYVAQNDEIEEVIFSGGDPLLCGDSTLRLVMARIASIPHLSRVRFHTRVPVTLPRRISSALVEALTKTRLTPTVVSHFNHPKEVNEVSGLACTLLKDAGMTCLNQSVLLKGVNDNANTLADLSRSLFEYGVLPYYLHQLDRSEGTAHFEVDIEEGLRIHESLKALLPGYLVPRYVIDIVGEPYKQDVAQFYSRRELT